MIIAPNATIAQFAEAYSGALFSMGVHSAAQALMSDGSIDYGSEAVGPFDKPLINIDGSRSTDARDLYSRLSSLEKPSATFQSPPRANDGTGKNSRFLSDINLLEKTLDKRKFAVKVDARVHTAGKLGLRQILKVLSGEGRIEGDLSECIPHRRAVKIAVDEMRRLDRENSPAPNKKKFSLDIARRRFISAVLYFAHCTSAEGAAEKFIRSANYLYEMGKYPVAAVAVAEISAALAIGDAMTRNPYLAHAADLWVDAAKVLLEEKDIPGTIIATYRGLKASALSSNYGAMSDLFRIRAATDWDLGNRNEAGLDLLRSALATLRMFRSTSSKHETWQDVSWRMRLGSEQLQSIRTIDTLKPFVFFVRVKEWDGFVRYPLQRR